MTPAMAPGIRQWEPSTTVISITIARPVITFCFFYFILM
jgi:hypothetical protein